MLQGETGTGKGLIARVIHDSGPRRVGPFIEVNCAAIPETMMEAELFGFEPGAFTDAKRAKPGLFEAASGGTLFLDEIDALPVALQGKLLTAIESRRVRRLGAVTERTVDVKLIAATNAVLPEVVTAGRFRADLYHRLAVVVLGLPPVRERGTDLLILAEAFLQRSTTVHGLPPKRLNTAAKAWLQGYSWPGNVRELSHVMERVALLHMGEEVEAETLMRLCQPLTTSTVGAKTEPAHDEVAAEHALPRGAEEIRHALLKTGGNVARAARLLGVSRDTVRYRMQRYGIARPRLRGPSPAVPPRSPGESARNSSPQDEEHRPELTIPLTLPYGEATQEEKMAVPPVANLAAGVEPDAPPRGPAWEQKSVTVLALELAWPERSGSEPIRYDPWTEKARWEQAVGDKVQGFGGILVQQTAAGFVWVFGVPQTLEQLPQRAVHSALAIRQMAVEATAPDLPPCPTVRLAVHLGAVWVDHQAADPGAQVRAVGETLALPVRILGQATPGELLITPEVGRLVDGWVALEARQLWVATGDPMRVGGYAVIGVSPGREVGSGRWRPIQSPFVGRTRELMLLEAIFEQVTAGRGQVVSLVGPPGMGKSRLLAEFRRCLSSQRFHYAEGRCLAYASGTPYVPIVNMLRDLCGIAADDSPEILRTRVRASLQQVGLNSDASLPYLLHLLDLPIEPDQFAHLSAESRKARTFQAIREFFLARSRHHPVVLAVEDLHWIDPTSEALLTSLVDGLAGAAILLLATCRSGYRAPWLDKSYATQIALQPLGPDESRQVVRRVMRDIALPPALEQQLLARGEGNPFFLEELAYTVREQGEGHPAPTVPDTIHAVLAGRMDRLPTPERYLLQAASVLGKDIAVPLLQAISELPEARLQQGLAQLQAAEFLHETQFFPEREYTFKHALTHEMAYGSLLQERRRVLHARIVVALEAFLGDQVAESVEQLAHHALRGEVWDKAVVYCRQAGEKAQDRSAYREAVTSFEKALGALQYLPEERATYEQAIDLRLALGSTLRPSGDFGRSMEYSREVESLAATLDDPRRLGEVSLHLSYHFYIMGAYDQAIVAAHRALERATDCGDAVLHAQANIYLSVAYRALGDYRGAINCLGQSLASLQGERRGERFGRVFLPSVLSRVYLTTCHAELGSFAAGEAFGQEGLRIAEEAGHIASLMVASWAVGMLGLRQGDLRKAIPMLERAMGICQDADIPLWFPWIAAALGAAYTVGGRAADAVRLLTQSVEQAVATGLIFCQTPSCHALAEAHLLAGRLEDAQPLGERALALAQGYQERGHEAYALRLIGEIATRREPHQAEQAEVHYQKALALAAELGIRPLAAHCHRSLGMLYRGTGQQVQARTELLAAITLYRTMEMTFWLPETEAALAQVQGDDKRS